MSYGPLLITGIRGPVCRIFGSFFKPNPWGEMTQWTVKTFGWAQVVWTFFSWANYIDLLPQIGTVTPNGGWKIKGSVLKMTFRNLHGICPDWGKWFPCFWLAHICSSMERFQTTRDQPPSVFDKKKLQEGWWRKQIPQVKKPPASQNAGNFFLQKYRLILLNFQQLRCGIVFVLFHVVMLESLYVHKLYHNHWNWTWLFSAWRKKNIYVHQRFQVPKRGKLTPK